MNTKCRNIKVMPTNMGQSAYGHYSMVRGHQQHQQIQHQGQPQPHQQHQQHQQMPGPRYLGQRSIAAGSAIRPGSPIATVHNHGSSPPVQGTTVAVQGSTPPAVQGSQISGHGAAIPTQGPTAVLQATTSTGIQGSQLAVQPPQIIGPPIGPAAYPQGQHQVHGRHYDPKPSAVSAAAGAVVYRGLDYNRNQYNDVMALNLNVGPDAILAISRFTHRAPYEELRVSVPTHPTHPSMPYHI